MQSRAESGDVPFQFWNEIYDDIERCIVKFFSINDFKHIFATSKKFNKMIRKLVYNQDNYNQSFDSVTILPAIKQAIVVQCFPFKKTDKNGNVTGQSDGDDEVVKKATAEKQKQKQMAQQITDKKELEMISCIKLIESKNVTISKWFLKFLMNDTKYLIYNLLISQEMNNETLKREMFAQLIINGLKTLKHFELNGIQQVNVNWNNKNEKEKEKEKDNEKDKDKDKKDETSNISVDEKKENINVVYSNDSDIKNDEMFMIANELLSLRFMNLLTSFIEEIVPTYWYSMEQFCSVFEQVLMFDHAYRHYFVNSQLISTLGDFYLREQSPYAKETPNKKYIKMGCRFDEPKFEPILHLLNILLRSCHSPATLKRHNKAIEQVEKFKIMENKNNRDDKEKLKAVMNLFELPITALSYHEKKYSFNDYKCFTLLPMSNRDIKLWEERVFWKRLICHLHDNKKISSYVQEMYNHWHDTEGSVEIFKIIFEDLDPSQLNQLLLLFRQQMVKLKAGEAGETK